MSDKEMDIANYLLHCKDKLAFTSRITLKQNTDSLLTPYLIEAIVSETAHQVAEGLNINMEVVMSIIDTDFLVSLLGTGWMYLEPKEPPKIGRHCV